MVPQRAVLIGRFQPFHKGHHQIVSEYRSQYDEFVVALGSANKERTPRNPLTVDEQRRVISACFPDLQTVNIQDEDRGEAGYQTWVDRLLARTDGEVVITGNQLVNRLIREYSGAEVVEPDAYNRTLYSGTEVRRRIRTEREWSHLVPSCCIEEIAALTDVIRASGEFRLGSLTALQG